MKVFLWQKCYYGAGENSRSMAESGEGQTAWASDTVSEIRDQGIDGYIQCPMGAEKLSRTDPSCCEGEKLSGKKIALFGHMWAVGVRQLDGWEDLGLGSRPAELVDIHCPEKCKLGELQNLRDKSPVYFIIKKFKQILEASWLIYW